MSNQKLQLPFAVGESVSNRVIMDTFQCKSIGGIRYSTATNTIVLIANHTIKPYVNRYDSNENVFLYTGEGQIGDQEMAHGNKRLNSARFEGTPVYLFEHFDDSRGYVYSGSVLVGEPYQETQSNEKGESRRVWIFPLKFIERGDGK
jgi:5-methylcytosine-specific restriction protein A